MAERARRRPHFLFLRVAYGFLLCVLLALMLAGTARAAPYAAVVMDARTGEIIHARNHDTRLHPASLTKMMTLYVAFEAIRNGEISLDTRVRISQRAAREPPSRLGLQAGQQIALRYLIRAAALRSGNDAATAIAEAISGSVENFAARMNRTAAAIGMRNTTFRNAHGLTQAGHLSTARDMTLLGRQLYFDFPEYYNLFSRRTEHAGIAQVRNTNWRVLDGYRGADGIKTGYTRAAGYNLTASAERNGVRIIVTVFGGNSVPDRTRRIMSLLDLGFREAPRRAAVRRPARPDYNRQPAQVAQAPSRQASPQGGAQTRAAGRVVRLQTAPTRSPFPQPRPLPEALLAAVQSSAEAARSEVAALEELDDDIDPDLPDELTIAARAAGTLPARSPLPPRRPEAVLALAAAATGAVQAPDAERDEPEAILAESGDDEAPDLAAAEAAGFAVIPPEEFAARTGADPDPSTDEGTEAVTAVAQGADEATQTAAAPETASVELPPRAQLAPEERPEDLQTDSAAETQLAAAPEAEAPDAQPPEAETPPADLLAAIRVEPGQLVIPGLPPIPVPADAQPEPAAAESLADAGPDPAAGDRLSVTPDGQIIWRDADLLSGLDALVARIEAGEIPDGTVGADRPDMLAGIVLTSTEDPDRDHRSQRQVLPETVISLSTSGSQLWAVDLGRFGSRFDAERTLLRVALSESTTLSGGVRRVVEAGGGFRGMVVSLTQLQAERTCHRLASSSQACTVVAP